MYQSRAVDTALILYGFAIAYKLTKKVSSSVYPSAVFSLIRRNSRVALDG